MGATDKKGRRAKRVTTKTAKIKKGVEDIDEVNKNNKVEVTKQKGKKEKVEKVEKRDKSESEIELIKEQQDDREDDNATTFVRNKNTKQKSSLNKKSNPKRTTKEKNDEEEEELLLASKDYEFKLVTEEPAAFIAFLTSLLSITNHETFSPLITNKGLYHICKDVDGYLISETSLDKTRIDSRGKYVCTSLETDIAYFTFSCKLKELKKMVAAKKEEKLKLSVKTSDTNKLNIVIYRNSGNISDFLPIEPCNENIPINMIPKYPKDLSPIFKVRGTTFAADIKQLKCTFVKLRIQKKALCMQGYDEQYNPITETINYREWDTKKPVKMEGFIPIKIITGISKYGAVSFYIRFFVHGNLPLKILVDVGNMGWHADYVTLKDKPTNVKSKDRRDD